MTILINAEGAFDKIQHLFIIKALSKIEIDRNFQLHMCRIPAADIILIGKKRRLDIREGSPLLLSFSTPY